MTPPLYFVGQQNTGGGVLTPSYRIILANKIDCVYLSSPCISCKVTEGLKSSPRQAVYIRNLTPSPYGYSPYIPLRKRLAVLWGTAGEEGKPDIKDYRLYRSISSMMSRRLYSRGILCCPPSLLWSRNQYPCFGGNDFKAFECDTFKSFGFVVGI